MRWLRLALDHEPAQRVLISPPVDPAAERDRVRELLAEMLAIDPLVDDAVRDCAGPPPHGARLARRVSRLARALSRARAELADLDVLDDFRVPLDDQLNYRQQMLEQALLIVFGPKTDAIERVRRGLASGLGPGADRFGDVVALATTALDVAALPEA